MTRIAPDPPTEPIEYLQSPLPVIIHPGGEGSRERLHPAISQGDQEFARPSDYARVEAWQVLVSPGGPAGLLRIDDWRREWERSVMTTEGRVSVNVIEREKRRRERQ